ncbi:exostosin family protein [uncultured Flavobacterium sp.]|uniref:exostosin domain-containing protein n=1 Tax=uncultured Flavobacterium sp. TaxID=165435 RepID=UPI0030EDCAC6
MKICISHIFLPISDKRLLFILARPFYSDSGWLISSKKNDEIKDKYTIVKNVEPNSIVLLPLSINYYYNTNNKHLLEKLNVICQENNCKAYGYISGDFGIKFPEFSNIIYFRQGGFKSQLSDKDKGFIVGLSDHFQRLYQKETISPSIKKELPIIGFCGHATLSSIKKAKEITKCLIENGKRFIKNPFKKVYEPLFASAYERAKLLNYFEQSNQVKTNFIYRENYRGGAITEGQRITTTLEYYDNILDSDYVLCIRGAGNFSVRFYETLMMGKIPIFVNTDCLLPFEDVINWKKHVVWIEWKDRGNVAQIVADFHSSLSADEFVHLQINNRKLWKETLSVKGILEMISNDI